MAKRKASSKAKNSSSKRQRCSGLEATTIPSLLDLNDNCLIHILSKLDSNDLNSFAICNRQCQALRAHESLPQIRTGRIVCKTDGTTVRAIRRAIRKNEWNNIFSGNQTHAVIEGIERVDMLGRDDRLREQECLTGVTSLRLVTTEPLVVPYQGYESREQLYPGVFYLASLFPNLEELVLSDVEFSGFSPPSMRMILFFRDCPNLRRLYWKQCSRQLNLTGYNLFSSPESCPMRELYIDDSLWFGPVKNSRDANLVAMENEGSFFVFGDVEHHFFLLQHCPHLERLSIKGASWYIDGRPEETWPISQQMLVKMVLNHPNLRWLRSDLTTENIAMLQEEKPHITFVSD